jgi:hypothetical protein
MSDASFQFSWGDFHRVRTQMDRAQKVLGKTDARRAPFGVFKFRPSGERYFKPIYRTGEYGKIRFFDKKSFSWFQRSKGSNRWESLPSGPDVANPEAVAPGIMSDKRRTIGRRGLAKKVWQWAGTRMANGGTASFFNVPDVASIKVSGGESNPTIRISDNLRYAESALKPGAISSVMEKAARNMAFNIEKQIEKTVAKK